MIIAVSQSADKIITISSLFQGNKEMKFYSSGILEGGVQCNTQNTVAGSGVVSTTLMGKACSHVPVSRAE